MRAWEGVAAAGNIQDTSSEKDASLPVEIRRNSSKVFLKFASGGM